jgi:hypothetical protein
MQLHLHAVQCTLLAAVMGRATQPLENATAPNRISGQSVTASDALKIATAAEFVWQERASVIISSMGKAAGFSVVPAIALGMAIVSMGSASAQAAMEAKRA